MRWAGLAAMGGLAGLGQAPFDLWWLSVMMIACWLVWPATNRRAAFGTGWWFGVGYFAVSLRWIVSPFLVDIEATGWMAPFGLLAMAAGGAVFWGSARWLAYWLAPHSVFLIAVLLALAEAERALVLTGFPWALIGHIWVDTPLAQLAAWGGPHFLSLVTVMLAWAIAMLFQRRWTAVAIPFVVTVLWWGIAPPPIAITDGPVVRILQPNAPQSQKWDPAHAPVFFDRLLEMTGKGPRPDLIVWPETSVPSLMEFAGSDLAQVADAAGGAPVVLGINRRVGLRYYNAALVVERGAVVSSVYDKTHIVPFGEFIPGGDLLARFGITGFAASQGQTFSAGGAADTMNIPAIGPARVLICYEGIFAEEVNTGTRPRLLLLITNDAWFGALAGPSQHLAQARLRAIEQGLPMARSANTGISAMIDPYGRILARTQMNETGALDVVLPKALQATPYSRWGDLPALAMILLLGGLVALYRRPI